MARPAGWISGNTLPATAGLRGYYVAPEVARTVRNVFDTPGPIAQLLSGPARVVGAVKETVLSGSPFHLVFEELQAARVSREQAGPVMGRSILNAVSPNAYDAWRMRWAPQYHAAAEAGVTLSEARNMGKGVDLLSGWSGLGIRSLIGGVGAGATTYSADKAGGAPDEAALTDATRKLAWAPCSAARSGR